MNRGAYLLQWRCLLKETRGAGGAYLKEGAYWKEGAKSNHYGTSTNIKIESLSVFSDACNRAKLSQEQAGINNPATK